MKPVAIFVTALGLFVVSACGARDVPHEPAPQPPLNTSAPAPTLPGTTVVGDLRDGQRRELCTWLVARLGPPREVKCSATNSVETGTVESCAAAIKTWSCTVATMLRCIDVMTPRLCNLHDRPECASFRDCKRPRR